MLFGEAVSMATPIPTTERAQVTCFHESFPPPSTPGRASTAPGAQAVQPAGEAAGMLLVQLQMASKVPHATSEEARASP